MEKEEQPKIVSDKGYTFMDPKLLNEIGFIQNAGCLLAIKYDTENKLRIVCASENIVQSPWLSINKVELLLDQPIEKIFEDSAVVVLYDLIKKVAQVNAVESVSNAPLRNYSMLNFIYSTKIVVEETLICCSAVVTNNPDIFLLEMEEVNEEMSKSFPNHEILLSGDMVERFRSRTSVPEIVGEFCDSCMAIIPGYDRGMVYRFDEDGTGVVIHENIRDPNALISSYLHLRFPASDIPPQARTLFVKGGLRFISDVGSTPIPLVSSNQWTERLDQSMGRLRAVSPCHVLYLKGMGVKATLSIPIIIDHHLWGLYVFHSYTGPVKPTIEKRIMLEMAASISAMRIDALRREAFVVRKLELNSLMSRLQGFKSFREFFQSFENDLFSLLKAHCLMAFMDNEYASSFIFGDPSLVLTEAGFDSLSHRCGVNTILPLTAFTEGLKGQGAGVVFFRHSNFSLATIRRCDVADVVWGRRADPANHIFDPNDKNFLSPQNSFEQYEEKARVTSKAWSKDDLEAVQHFVERVTQFQHTEMLASFRMSLEQSNAECAQAMDAAKERNEFFAHMSHELRTPFHGVLSALQILQKVDNNEVAPLPKEERQEILDSALECGQNMLRTLNDILTIAKNSHTSEVSYAQVSLIQMLQTTKRMMGPIADNKKVSLRVEMNPTNMDVEGHTWSSLVVVTDEVRVLQIINNLTSNAIKFTNANGSVVVRAHVVSAERASELWRGHRVKYEAATEPSQETLSPVGVDKNYFFVFEVEDSGKGVTQEETEVMFDAYKQVSQGVTKAYQGTGLGLHICKIHCQDLKGTLGVASTPGKGTLFMGFVPVKVSVRSRPPTPSKEHSTTIDFGKLPPNPPNEIKKPFFKAEKELLKSIDRSASSEENLCLAASSMEKVERENNSQAKATPCFLLVDDSTVNLRLTKRKLLMTLGDDANIMLAFDGTEAIEKVAEMMRDGTYAGLHGIVMDYHMPKCSGVEAIQRIRLMEQEVGVRGVHIIGYTADLTDSSTNMLIDAGADETLPKPTPVGQLEDICVRLSQQNRH